MQLRNCAGSLYCMWATGRSSQKPERETFAAKDGIKGGNLEAFGCNPVCARMAASVASSEAPIAVRVSGGIRMPLFCNARTNCAAMALASIVGYAVSREVANF